jgi:hypothetical protein
VERQVFKIFARWHLELELDRIASFDPRKDPYSSYDGPFFPHVRPTPSSPSSLSREASSTMMKRILALLALAASASAFVPASQAGML